MTSDTNQTADAMEAHSPTSSQNENSVTSFFSRVEWSIFGVILVIGLLLRWALLDMRPYHHDESLHGMYGRYFYDWPNNNYYKYDPMLHGPMLYNCMRFIYASFGDSLWAARIPPALMGSLFMLMPLLFRRFFSKNSVLLLTGFIAFSPTLVYWSRFLREDYWVVSGMLMMLYGFISAPARSKAFWVFMGLAIQWCTKENIFVSLAIFSGYLVFEFYFRIIAALLQDGRWDEYSQAVRKVSSQKVLVTSGALIVGALVLHILGAPTVLNGTNIVTSVLNTLRETPVVPLKELGIPLTFDLNGEQFIGVALGKCLTALSYLFFQQKLHSIALWGFFIVTALHFALFRPKESYLNRLVQYVNKYPWETVLGFTVSFLVYCWFYSGGFRYLDGIVHGFGAKGFEYWMEHHGKERIEGPFNFHTYVLGWYELPFFIAFFVHLALFYRKTFAGIQLLGGVALVGLILALCLPPAALPGQTPEMAFKEFWSFFKLKDNFDLIGLFILLTYSPLITIHHLWRKEYGLAAAAYFFSSTYFVYSYLGEKVPWLSLYPLIFGIPYLALFFKDHFDANPIKLRDFPVERLFLYSGLITIVLASFFVFERLGDIPNIRFFRDGIFDTIRYSYESIGAIASSEVFGENADFFALGALLIVLSLLNPYSRFLGNLHLGRWATAFAALFMIRAAIQTNFLYAGKETEYLSQVHTTYEAADFARNLVDNINNERDMYRPKILVTGDATWPYTWYFRNIPNEYRFSASPSERQNYTFIVEDHKEAPVNTTDSDSFVRRKMNLRGWWVPDFKKMTLKNFLRYSINHYPWSPSGFTHVTVMQAKDTARFKSDK